MPRLTADVRLRTMSDAIAYADDRRALGIDRVPIGEVADHLGLTVDTVSECLEPLDWLEFEVPGDIVDLLGGVRVEDGYLVVEEAWWRRLAVLTPPDAARLYTKAAAAASLDADPSMPLRTAMRKLRAIVGVITVVEGAAPPIVEKLREVRAVGSQVIADIEGHDRTLVTSRARFRVMAVFRQGDDWMATLQSVIGDGEAMLGAGDPITIPVGRITALVPAEGASDAMESPLVIDPDPVLDVTIVYAADRDWVLDPFDASGFTEIGGDRFRCEVRVWGIPELKTLMLRLGPTAELIEPDHLRSIGTDAASEILELYSVP